MKVERLVEVEAKPPEGLADGGHVYPTCSNCRAILMDVWRTRPHEPQVWSVRASCPFCGDKSFVVEVQGGFHTGGYGRPKEDDEDDDTPSTVVDHFEVVDGCFEFKILKASHDSKPVFGR